MLAAGLPIGKSLAEADLVDEARAIMTMMARGARCRSRSTWSCAKEFSAHARGNVKASRTSRADDMILDIGPQTAARLAAIIAEAGTIVWNGPVGVFEFDAVRGRHPAARRGDRGFAALLDRRRRRHARRDRQVRRHRPDLAISPPAAARSSSSSRARAAGGRGAGGAPRADETRSIAVIGHPRELGPDRHLAPHAPDPLPATKIVATLGPASQRPDVLERHDRAPASTSCA